MTTETLIEVPLEPTTRIKPSEAVRLGCLVRPVKGTGRFFEGDDKACALGAMAIGLGFAGPFAQYEGAWDIVRDALPPYIEVMCTCDDGGYRRTSLGAIWHMNDAHDWPRERVADWLAEQGL